MHHKRKRYWDLDVLLRLRAFDKVRERAKWLQNVQKMSRKSKMNLLLSLQGCDWCDIGSFNFISLDLETLWCCHSNETSFAEHLLSTIYFSRFYKNDNNEFGGKFLLWPLLWGKVKCKMLLFFPGYCFSYYVRRHVMKNGLNIGSQQFWGCLHWSLHSALFVDYHIPSF